jgi:hypothetical protein
LDKDKELANIETVLPSWRFLMSDEMGEEAVKFWRIFDYFPHRGMKDELRKFAKTTISDLPTGMPLISRADEKLGGWIRGAIHHLGETVDDTRQPGYLYLMGNIIHHARRVGQGEVIRSGCQRFVLYRKDQPKTPDDNRRKLLAPTPQYPGFEYARNKDGSPMSEAVKAKLYAKAKYVDRDPKLITLFD